jgi:hypothetical protein
MSSNDRVLSKKRPTTLAPVKTVTLEEEAARRGLKTKELAGPVKQFEYKHKTAACRWSMGFCLMCGCHRLYLDEPGCAALLCLTLGGLGFYWMSDGCQLEDLVDKRNNYVNG